MGPKMFPTICGTYMKLVTKYQISAINSCWEKCDEKCAYIFNVYKNQQSQQTGSRNLMGPKMLPTIWGTYMKLMTKYQISAINSYWEKCDENFLGRTEGRTEVKQCTPPPPSGSGGIITTCFIFNYFSFPKFNASTCKEHNLLVKSCILVQTKKNTKKDRKFGHWSLFDHLYLGVRAITFMLE
jgi:hypothetical protein